MITSHGTMVRLFTSNGDASFWAEGIQLLIGYTWIVTYSVVSFVQSH